MTDADRPGGPIDPWSEYDLYDVVNGELPSDETTEYRGIHLQSRGGRVIDAQPDGYAGFLGTFYMDRYDDVLELIAELNDLAAMWDNLQENGDLEERVERAGKLITSDPSKAEEEPDLYLHVPQEMEVSA